MAKCMESGCRKQAVAGSDFCEDHPLTTRVVRYVASKKRFSRKAASAASGKRVAKKVKKVPAKKATRKKR